MPAPELQFYTNLVAPGITENGQDVINAQELETALSTKGYLTGNIIDIG
jgi:hypothetical protein